MRLTIYGIAASRAVRPLWVAHELGLCFEHVPTPYQGGATRLPDFLALNPNGHIPVVVDHRPEGDVVVWESMACALYLARHHGPADGASSRPRPRGRMPRPFAGVSGPSTRWRKTRSPC